MRNTPSAVSLYSTHGSAAGYVGDYGTTDIYAHDHAANAENIGETGFTLWSNSLLTADHIYKFQWTADARL